MAAPSLGFRAMLYSRPDLNEIASGEEYYESVQKHSSLRTVNLPTMSMALATS